MLVIKWISRTTTFIFVIVFLLILYATISSRINGGTPKVFGKEIMTVLSGSMEPGIKTGSVIAVNPVPPSEGGTFKPGDVITYKTLDDPNTLITHRIVEVNGTGASVAYMTKGDNNDAADPKPIPAGNVVGKYADFTVPYLGYFLSWVKSKAGIATVMIVPGIILIVSSMVSLFRYIIRLESSEEKKDASDVAPPATNG